jgi:Flp pilus assembly protein TadG
VTRFRMGADREQGSTIPLILGLFLIALLMVGGSVAAGDAFIQQSELQSVCDSAALAAAAEAADLNGGRHVGPTASSFLVLGAVQQVVDEYRERDPARRTMIMQASLSADQVSVAVRCSQTRMIAFGAMFGFANGVRHNVTSTAKGRLQTN